MTSWAYRATPSGANFSDTVVLLTQYAFLWRPLFKDTTQRSGTGYPPTYAYLGAINPDADRLFVYFSQQGVLTYVGGYAFAPMRPRAHPAGAAPAVVRVSPNDPLVQVLQQGPGYHPDTFLGAFTGFDLVPLDDGAMPPGQPVFDGQYAVGRFPPATGAQPAVHAPSPPSASPWVPDPRTPARSGMCFGVDWSGASVAGDKVWCAELDPAKHVVRSVSRPWQGQPPVDVIAGVAGWLKTIRDAWVAFDFPFGIAACDRMTLLGTTPDSPRAWGAALQARYADANVFIDSATRSGLIGVNRRMTDGNSPFAPLLLQLIRQTYWGMRLLALLPSSIAVLPWDHASTAPVRVIETCPAVLLRALGESNVGYKLRPGSEMVREDLLTNVLAATDWTCTDEVRTAAVRDYEGDALDAVLAGLAAWRASGQDHAAVATLPSRETEGHIYA